MQRTVIVLSGATASCKTAVASALTRMLGRRRGGAGGGAAAVPQVVSMDAVQVYRGAEIGAATPCAAELAATPTGGIGTRTVGEVASAGELAAEGRADVEAVLAGGGVPVVVGGSGLYMDWLVHGAHDAPKADPAVRAAVRARVAAAPDWDALVDELRHVLPDRAERLVDGDWVKLTRALEIAAQGGPSAEHARPRVALADALDARVCVFNLFWPRLDHLRMVDARCEAMVAAGLLPEVASLVAGSHVAPEWAAAARLAYTGPPLLPGHPVARAIGYAQALPLLADAAATGSLPPRTLAAFVKDFQAKSRQLTRKQNKWFARPDYLWTPLHARSVDDVAGYIAATVADDGAFDAALAAQAAAARPPWRASPDDLAALRTYRPTLTTFGTKAGAAVFADAAVAHLRTLDAALARSASPHTMASLLAPFAGN